MDELAHWGGLIIAGVAGVFAYGKLSQRVEQLYKENDQLKKDIDLFKIDHKSDFKELFKKIDELVGMVQEFKLEVEKYISSDKEQKLSFKETVQRIEKEIHIMKNDV